jgi:hypothetical protein
MLADAFTDEPIVLGSDDGPEDGDNDLDDTHAPIALDVEHLDHDALELDIPPSPFSHPADQVEDEGTDDGDKNIDKTIFPRGAKRQRSGSPRCEPNEDLTSTLVLPGRENGESSTVNACGTGSGDSAGDEFLSKRRKLSEFLDSRTTSSCHKSQSPRSLSPGLEELEKPGDGTDVPTNLPVEDTPTRTTTPPPELSVSDSLREPQLSPELADFSQGWEVREVIGKEYVGGVLHYMVEWCPTLQPVHSLENAQELVDEFEGRLRALHKDRKGGLSIKRNKPVTVEGNIAGAQQQKRPRGRPRKR